MSSETSNGDTKTLTYRHRIVIVRHGKRSRRWRWAVEEDFLRRGEWRLEKTGFAWSFAGAKDKAHRAIYGQWSVTRWEAVVMFAKPFVPDERPPSPVPAELVSNG